MTFKEKWLQDHPDGDFESTYTKMCPSQFGYEPLNSYGKVTEAPFMTLCNSGHHAMPKKFEVIIHGPNGYFETGRYKTTTNANVLAASDLILEDLGKQGYVRLWHDDGSCSVVCSEAVMSFSVKLLEEAEE